MKKVSLITFGCAKNLVDSEVMAGYLGQAGFEFVEDPKNADIIILNTCGFIQPSKDEAEDAIQDALSLKKKSGSQRIVVAGCYSERYEPILRERYPDIDAWLGVKDFDKIVKVVEGKDFSASDRTYLYSHKTPRAISTPASWAYLKISEGCSHQCAFCSIPLIKGAYRSRPTSSIVEEVRHLVSGGVREINLISQDTTYFGRDKARPEGLARLLEELVKIRELEWIRILYGYPEEITEALVEVMQEPKICSYLDIPFQHSDPVLIQKMKRAMNGRRALELLEKIRKKLSRVAIRTSIIVGFPGEGRREFEDLRAFVKEAEFDHLGVFTYSKEDGTDAYALGDPVKESIKQRRRDQIMEIQAGISSKKMKAYVGRTVDILIEGIWKDDSRFLIGRGRFQAPEVDGVIFARPVEQGNPALGPIQKVEITDSEVYDLHGKLAG
jgi:ribosomal protein S12 methylthiotransferase